MARIATDSTRLFPSAHLAARQIADRLDPGTRRAAEAAAQKAGIALEDWLLLAIRRGASGESRRPPAARSQPAAGRARSAVLRGFSKYDAGVRLRLERRAPVEPVTGHLRADAAAEAARISDFVRGNPEFFRRRENVASRPLPRWVAALASLPVLALGLGLLWQSSRLDLAWVGWIVAFLSDPVEATPSAARPSRRVSLTLDLERVDPAASPAHADE